MLPQVSHIEYATRTLLRSEKMHRAACALLRFDKIHDTQMDSQTDGRPTVTLHLPLDPASVTNVKK